MKTILVTLLLAACVTSIIEKHYHYHLDGLNLNQQEINHLMADIKKHGHKGFFGRIWCYMSNFSSASRNACLAADASKDNSNKDSSNNTAQKKHRRRRHRTHKDLTNQ